jgi:hypothetical protein
VPEDTVVRALPKLDLAGVGNIEGMDFEDLSGLDFGQSAENHKNQTQSQIRSQSRNLTKIDEVDSRDDSALRPLRLKLPKAKSYYYSKQKSPRQQLVPLLNLDFSSPGDLRKKLLAQISTPRDKPWRLSKMSSTGTPDESQYGNLYSGRNQSEDHGSIRVYANGSVDKVLVD